MNVLVNPRIEKHLEYLRQHLPHALLIVGKKGSGARTLAHALAGQHTKTPQLISPEKDKKPDRTGSIGIEQARKLYETVRSHTTNARVIVIEDAHLMTAQAQNALLKLLEEPNKHTHFILSAHTRQGLLPTILSRVQSIELPPITPDQTNTLLDTLQVHDPRIRAQLQFVAAGKPAELIHLAQTPTALTARGQIVSDARTLLQADPYERLKLCHAYKDDRARTLRLVDTCLQLLRGSLEKQPSSNHIISELDRYVRAYERIDRNGNVRLLLAQLVV